MNVSPVAVSTAVELAVECRGYFTRKGSGETSNVDRRDETSFEVE